MTYTQYCLRSGVYSACFSITKRKIAAAFCSVYYLNEKGFAMTSVLFYRIQLRKPQLYPIKTFGTRFYLLPAKNRFTS